MGALAATAACGGPSGPSSGNEAHAPAGNAAAPALPTDNRITYSVEGPGIGGEWHIGSDGKGSFDATTGDVLGRMHRLSAQIDVGAAGFAEIERLVAGFPAGELPHCIDTQESMVAMGWRRLVREGAGGRIESGFNLNCKNYGPGQALVDRLLAADERMRRWAEQAPGHEGSLEAVYGNQTQ